MKYLGFRILLYVIVSFTLLSCNMLHKEKSKTDKHIYCSNAEILEYWRQFLSVNRTELHQIILKDDYSIFDTQFVCPKGDTISSNIQRFDRLNGEYTILVNNYDHICNRYGHNTILLFNTIPEMLLKQTYSDYYFCNNTTPPDYASDWICEIDTLWFVVSSR